MWPGLSLSLVLQTLCLVGWIPAASGTAAQDPSPCPSLHCPGVLCTDWELAREHQAEFLTSMESTVWANGSEILPLEQANPNMSMQRPVSFAQD